MKPPEAALPAIAGFGTTIASLMGKNTRGSLHMKAISPVADRVSSWLETQYCASVAATLLARVEYFELLEDAMVSPVRLVNALSAWREHATQAEVLGDLVGTA
jgi:hypothetical protein